jgi:hypothetical protein
MLEIVVSAGVLLGQATKLLENETVAKAVKGFTNWVGEVIGKTFAKEKIIEIETSQNVEQDVAMLQSQLEFVLRGNSELQQQLAEKIAGLHELLKKEGIPLPTKTNTLNISGERNIALQDINTQGNITIGS